jgi:hypothetical protein
VFRCRRHTLRCSGRSRRPLRCRDTADCNGDATEIDDSVDVGSGVAVIEVPSRSAVIGDIDSCGCDGASNGSDDAAGGEAVNPHVLQQHVMGALIGDHPVCCIVVDWKARIAITWNRWNSESDAL